MPTRAVVLGAGMVGRVIATDLAAEPDWSVLAVDHRPEALALLTDRAARLGVRVETRQADLADPSAITSVLSSFKADVVSGAMASEIAHRAMAAVIDAGLPYCDISFMPEDFTDLSARAKAKGVTVVADCGVAPGMSHILAARSARMLDACDELTILVGGLPVTRTWPFDYKAAFSPADVIEEYTRPARLVEHGRVVTKPALSEPQLIDLPGVGTLEAFNTDGLRSLTTTLPAPPLGRTVPTIREKTLRYPGHIELMRIFRHIGLFSTDPITLPSGTRVIPRELLSTLMFPHWQYPHDGSQPDLTVMRIEARGTRAGQPTRITWDLLDHADTTSPAPTTSMARTTAFPCAIVTRMLARRQITTPGVLPPEHLAAYEPIINDLLRHQLARGVAYSCTITPDPA